MKKNIIFYIMVIGGLGLLLWIVLQQGKTLEINKGITEVLLIPKKETGSIFNELFHNLQHPLSIFILQMLSIISIGRLLGWLLGKIGQPAVIGEIIAGIFLGPSLMGLFFPAFSTFLFPATSLPNREQQGDQ